MEDRILRDVLRWAAKGRFTASPNPLVGCVIIDAMGEVVGRGFHRAPGEPHAEIHALAEAGERAAGGCLFVNLEPCSHQGLTPPCTDAVIAGRLAKVVACHKDPDARVAGRGFEALCRAGIKVETGGLCREAIALNLAFVTRHLLDRPAVTLKWAMSADGRIATSSGESQWISSPEGRRWALELREEHDAILVGSGTALVDNPSLNRRLGKAERPNLRVILDRRLRIGPKARMFDMDGEVVIYTESQAHDRIEALEARSATVRVLPKADLPTVLTDLSTRGVQSLLVEGGAEVLGSFVASCLFDRVEICWAPLLIGGAGAPGPLAGEGIQRLAAAPRIEDRRVRHRGPDLISSGFREGFLAELEGLLSC